MSTTRAVLSAVLLLSFAAPALADDPAPKDTPAGDEANAPAKTEGQDQGDRQGAGSGEPMTTGETAMMQSPDDEQRIEDIWAAKGGE